MPGNIISYRILDIAISMVAIIIDAELNDFIIIKGKMRFFGCAADTAAITIAALPWRVASPWESNEVEMFYIV